jgi:hypothetical protein
MDRVSRPIVDRLVPTVLRVEAARQILQVLSKCTALQMMPDTQIAPGFEPGPLFDTTLPVSPAFRAAPQTGTRALHCSTALSWNSGFNSAEISAVTTAKNKVQIILTRVFMEIAGEDFIRF